nr:PREDICTED: uncharacterized protein LOC104223422 [Nicotiana sylvestris]
MDGVFKGNYKKGGIGGIFRDKSGNCILGYKMPACGYTSTYMELPALKSGLQIAKHHNFLSLEFETNATEIPQLLSYNNYSLYSNLVNECKLLLKELENPLIRHNFREGNRLAHVLAMEGDKQPSSTPLSAIFHPPDIFWNLIYRMTKLEHLLLD